MDTSSLIAALAPAFAAGFALQRLLEILDPILEKLASGNNKKIALGIVSLLCGAGLATWPQFRVLSHLVVPEGSISTWLDYLVTSLIISGGTEGFNSILKFLNYKKAESKATAVTEKIRAGRSLQLSGSTLTLEKAMNADLNPTTPEDVYKDALQNQVRITKNDPTIVIDFKNGKLNQHMADNNEAQVVVLEATEVAADQFERVLNQTGKNKIRNSISRDTSYATAIDVMDTAVSEGADPKAT